MMNPKSLLVLGTVILASTLGGRAQAAESPATCVRIVEVTIDPAQLAAFTVALKEEVAASVQEPGVLAIYAAAEKDHPDHLRLFELYADDAAYKTHQGAAAFQRYKVATQKMVRSRKLIEMEPVFLGQK
jgi:quinol monooxygenase YgiN